jgi:hypothetical protein
MEVRTPPQEGGKKMENRENGKTHFYHFMR